MVAELEDTSKSRTQPTRARSSETLTAVASPLSSADAKSPMARNTRRTYRHTLPAIFDEPWHRHMKTWHFDEPTQTWRPQSPVASPPARATRSHPNLCEQLGRGGDAHMVEGADEKSMSSTVLLAELNTNIAVGWHVESHTKE